MNISKVSDTCVFYYNLGQIIYLPIVYIKFELKNIDNRVGFFLCKNANYISFREIKKITNFRKSQFTDLTLLGAYNSFW